MNHHKKIVLAYSGGLDTSVIAHWLQHTYDAEVITFTADIGQGEEVEPARQKALKLGIKQIFIENLSEDFTQNFVWPMLRANPLYEGEYLLGTAIARPLIAKRLVEIAHQCGADAVAHGATGKGNDQVRFELGVIGLAPELQIVAPWREWNMRARSDLVAYAQKHSIQVDTDASNRPDYSMDANLLHISYEGGSLEDLAAAPSETMWQRTRSIGAAPQTPEEVTIGFECGDPVSLNQTALSAAELLHRLNQIAGKHGIGRVDMVENRYVGIKSRGCYETPGATVLLKARRALESITLDRELAHLKEDWMPRYVRMIYNGYWWSPEREALQQIMDSGRQYVSGEISVRLHQGNVIMGSKTSPHSLYNANLSSFEEDGGAYDQTDAAGFIALNALRLKQKRGT